MFNSITRMLGGGAGTPIQGHPPSRSHSPYRGDGYYDSSSHGYSYGHDHYGGSSTSSRHGYEHGHGDRIETPYGPPAPPPPQIRGGGYPSSSYGGSYHSGRSNSTRTGRHHHSSSKDRNSLYKVSEEVHRFLKQMCSEMRRETTAGLDVIMYKYDHGSFEKPNGYLYDQNMDTKDKQNIAAIVIVPYDPITQYACCEEADFDGPLRYPVETCVQCHKVESIILTNFESWIFLHQRETDRNHSTLGHRFGSHSHSRRGSPSRSRSRSRHEHDHGHGNDHDPYHSHEHGHGHSHSHGYGSNHGSHHSRSRSAHFELPMPHHSDRSSSRPPLHDSRSRSRDQSLTRAHSHSRSHSRGGSRNKDTIVMGTFGRIRDRRDDVPELLLDEVKRAYYQKLRRQSDQSHGRGRMPVRDNGLLHPGYSRSSALSPYRY